VTKHASENCGVGRTLVLWKYQQDPKCPRCDQPEDTEHVILCRGCGADDIWQANIRKLTSSLTKRETHSAIQEAILRRLYQWRYRQTFSTFDDEEVNTAIAHQDSIGWKNFLEGLPAKQWQQLQQRHYTTIGSHRTGRKWIRKLLRHLHTLAFDQWKHRNEVKHRTLRPRHAKMIADLEEEIIDLYIAGTEDLAVEDHHHFNVPLTEILGRNLSSKKAWLHNVHSAKRRKKRKRLNDPDYDDTSRKRSRIFLWMRTNRAE